MPEEIDKKQFWRPGDKQAFFPRTKHAVYTVVTNGFGVSKSGLTFPLTPDDVPYHGDRI